MPTYQYACTNPECGNRFELVQSFTDPAATECPVCGQPVRKVYGSVGVVFKGSGFYRTDSRSDAKSSSTVAASDSKKSESKSDSSSSSSSTSSSASSTSTSAPASSSSSGSSGSSGSGSSKAAASA
ncbi:FmdB family zinc ribbon protein [Jatrophihabitans fulvus]